MLIHVFAYMCAYVCVLMYVACMSAFTDNQVLSCPCNFRLPSISNTKCQLYIMISNSVTINIWHLRNVSKDYLTNINYTYSILYYHIQEKEI